MSNDKNKSALGRRQFLMAGAGIVAAGAVLRSGPAAADVAAADKMATELTGGTGAKSGKVTIEGLPEIAENARSVPFTISVDSPMTANDYVKSIHVLAEDNPSPAVASFHLSPAAGQAKVGSRMRLAKTQNIRAIAVMSSGEVYEAKQEVKVTIGGCGG